MPRTGRTMRRVLGRRRGDRMTEQKAIEILNTKLHLDCKIKEAIDEMEARCVAINALEKQIPKKVVNIDDFADYAECPSCGAIATDHLGCLYGWCRKCGQKLKRSE